MTTEAVLASFVDAVKDDAGMLVVLLHGSRASKLQEHLVFDRR